VAEFLPRSWLVHLEKINMKFIVRLLAASLIAGQIVGSTAFAQSLAEIEAAAKKEGMLTTIALPHY
jgi:hypothetical protein